MDTEFQRRCKSEGLMIRARLTQFYTRAPEKRQEDRLEMAIADDLENKRDRLTFGEFSAIWNQRPGDAP